MRKKHHYSDESFNFTSSDATEYRIRGEKRHKS